MVDYNTIDGSSAAIIKPLSTFNPRPEIQMSPKIKGSKKQFRTNADSKARTIENERFSVDIKECKLIRVRENTFTGLPGQNEDEAEH